MREPAITEAEEAAEEKAPLSFPAEAAVHRQRVREHPADEAAWDEIDEHARTTQKPDVVSLLYREVLARDLSPEVVDTLGKRAVAFHDEWFEDPTLVIEILRRVIEVAPFADWAFERLSLLLTMAERWDDLLAAYDAALARCEDKEKKKALLDEAARIAKDFAGSTDRAISYLKQLVPLRPEDAQLAQSLERRLLLQKRHRDLIDVWRARLPVLAPAEVLGTRVRMAETWLEKLGDAKAALDVVREILASKAGEQNAWALLERIGTFAPAPLETRRAALGLLKERLAAADKSTEVVRAIELLLNVADDAEERIALRSEAAKRLAQASRLSEATLHAAEWLVLSPRREVKDELADLAERSGSEQRYADALVRAAAATSDGTLRVEFLLDAGRVRHEKLGELDGAIELYSRVLDDPSVNEAALLDAARRLTVLLVQPEHRTKRLAVLERLTALEPEGEDQKRVMGEAARLALELGETDHALDLWRRRLDRDGEDREALDASVEILEANKRWEALVAALERRHDASADPEARRADLVHIADVHRSRLDDLPSAIDAWRRVEKEFGPDPETVDALADLSSAAQRWSDVTALLRDAANQVQDVDRRAAHLSRMGDVYRMQRDAPLRAVEAYREALESLPAHEGAREGLRALLDERDAGGTAVETLAKAYADAGEWQGTLALVERRVYRAKDDVFRRDVLLEAAQLLESRSGDRVSAMGYVRRAFALTHEPVIELELMRLAEDTDEWQTCADGYAEAAASVADPKRRAELLLSHGLIVEQRLSEPALALESYARVTELEPGHVSAQTALVRVAGVTGRWDVAAEALVVSAGARYELDEGIVETFESVADRVDGWERATSALAAVLARGKQLPPSIAHDVERRLALWHRDRRNDPDAAQAVLRRTVSHKADPDSLRMLAELERRAPGHELVDTLLRLAAATGDDLDVLYEAASVALQAVRDRDLARPILERLYKLSEGRWRERAPSGGADASLSAHALWALERLVEHWLDAGDGLRAVDLLEAGASLPFSRERARELCYRAAELSAGLPGGTSRAIDFSRSILDEAPDDAKTITLLSGLYAKEGRLAELLELRQRELALGPQQQRRLALRLDIARVTGELGGDTAERVAALQGNLEDRPGHLASVDALAEILVQLGREPELHAELVKQAQAVSDHGDPQEAASLWARAGSLAERVLGETDRALDAYRRSVALEPSIDVYDALARIHTAKSEHVAAVSWLEKRLERTSAEDTEDHRSTVLRLAECHRAAGREDAARAVLSAALSADPAATGLRGFLAELYRAAGDFALLAPLLEGGVDYAETDAEKVDLLQKAAHVQRRKLSALGAAIPLLEHAASLAPEDRAVRLSLADALRSAGRFGEARDLLEATLSEFGRRRTPERAMVHYHLARIAHAEGDLESALAQLESASSIERSDPKILKLLGDVARQKGELESAERAYRALLLIVRRKAVTSETDGTEEEVIAASEVMYVLHQMAAGQGQGDRANDLLESAFETAASNNLEALRLERALRAEGRADLVLRVLDTRLDRISDPAAAAEILVARAELLGETGRLGDALDSLLSALGKTPDSLPLLSSAHELAVRSGAVERYLSRLSELAAAGEPALASDLWMRLGAVAESDVKDAARAADYYERSLATGKKGLRAYRALCRVLTPEDPERLRRVLVQFIDSPAEDEPDASPRVEATYRLAELELASPAAAEDGARRLEQALERAPDYDRALAAIGPAVKADPERAALVHTYERIARAIGGDALLLDALVLRSALPDASVDLLRDAVELAKTVGETRRVNELLARLVHAARREGVLGEYVWALVEVAAEREEAGDFVNAVALLDEASRHSSDAEAFELGLKVAHLSATELDDLRRAADVYERLRREEPTDARAWKPLLDVLRRLGAFAEVEACIAETVEAVYDPAERNHLRMERGRILLEDPARQEEAETVLRAVLDEDPDHAQATVVLAELLERTGRIDELNELIGRQLEGARDRGDAAAISALTLRIGKSLEQDSRAEAIALYRESLAATNNDRALLEALLRLYGEGDDPQDRAFVLERLLEIETGRAAARLALELATVAESLGDEAAVERALRRGYEAAPADDTARDRLVNFYRARQDFAGVAQVLAEDARRRPAAEAAQQLREAAQLYEERLEDPLRAATLYGEARSAEPGDVELVFDVTRAYAAAGRPEDAFVAVSGALASGVSGAEPRARLLALRARLRPSVEGERASVIATSIEDLDQAAALSGGGFEAEILEFLEMQRTVAAAASDDAAERAATMRLAQLLPKAGDQRRGLELLVGWVKRKPNDAEAVRGLGQFAANSEKWSAAAKAFARLVEITDGADQVDAVVRLAEACERAGSPMDARAPLEQVYAKAPHDEMLRSRLRRTYEAAGAYAELAGIMITEAERAPDDASRFARLVEAGDLSLRVQGGEPTAIVAFRRAYELRADAHDVIIKLCDALANTGEIEEAANILDRAIDAFGKRRSPELAELQHAMARVGRIAGDWEAVFAWLDAAVQTDRQNGAAASELAVIAMERGEHDIAIKALQAITLLKGEAPMSKAEAYLRQGMIAETKGDPKKAVFLAKRALTQEPDYADAKAFLDRLGAG